MATLLSLIFFLIIILILYPRLMIKICLLQSLFVFLSLTIHEGWILNKTIPTALQLTRLLSHRDSLLIQTPHGIHTAPFTDPNAVLERILTQRQVIGMASAKQNDSYVYMGQRFINYQQANSSRIITVPQMEFQSNLIQFGDRVFFFNSAVSFHLLAYNMLSDEIQEGPFLTSKLSELSVMEISRCNQWLFVSFDGDLYLVDLTVMAARKIITSDQPIRSITLSDSGKFLSVYQSNLITHSYSLYRLDESGKTYVLIFMSVYSQQSKCKNSFNTFEDEDRCFSISYNELQSSTNLRNIIQFSCRQPYDRIIDKIAEGATSVHQLSADQKTVYSIVEKEQMYLMRHIISEEGFVLEGEEPFPQSIYFHHPEQIQILEVFAQMLVFKSLRFGIITLLNIENSNYMCVEQISAQQNFLDQIQQLALNLQENIIYLLFHDTEDTLYSINLLNCQISSKIYDSKIQEIFFLKSKMFIKFDNEDENLYEVNQKNKELIGQGYRIHSQSHLIYKNTVYGIHFNYPTFKLVSYDINFIIKKSAQLLCNVNQIYLLNGPNHLTVACNNIYHLYNADLQYLGSTSLILPELHIDNMKETFSPSLRFNKVKGELHSSTYSQWKINNVITESDKPFSNFYFYNSSEAFYLSVSNNSFYLYYIGLSDIKILVKQKYFLNLNSSQVVLSPAPLKWSCSKMQIMLEYSQIYDEFNTYINVYNAFPFKLLYTHRVVVSKTPSSKITGGEQFIADLSCSNVLFISHREGFEVVELDKRRSFSPRSVNVNEQLSMSSDGQKVIVFGTANYSKKCVEVWDMNTMERDIGYIQPNPRTSSSRVFFVYHSVYLLDEEKLYANFTMIMDQISDCTYLDELTLICLDTDGNFKLIPESPIQVPHREVDPFTKLLVSHLEDVLIRYNATALDVLSIAPKGFRLNQSISFSKFYADVVAVSGDSNSIVAYSRIYKTFYLWQRGSCQPRSTLQDGVCVCLSQFIKHEGSDSSGQCLCPSGKYIDGETCSECSFFCSECSESGGNCSSLSSAGIIMIVGCVAVVGIIGGLLYRCLRRWRQKARKSQQSLMDASELTAEYTSVSD